MIHIAIESADLERFVQEKVASGSFTSAADVIAAGLSLLAHDPDAALPVEEMADLRGAISVGIDDLEQGRVSNWNAQSMKARIEREFGGGR